MKKLIFILLILTGSFCFSQTNINSKALEGIWVIENSTFPDSTVRLKVYEASTDSSRIYSGYEFTKGGTVNLVSHNPGSLKFCGNGTPYIKKGTWLYKNKCIRIAATGGYFAAGTYSYDLAYKVESFNNGHLVLKKTKTYKNKRCETCPN